MKQYENDGVQVPVVRKLQLAEIKLIRLFVDICEKEKLTYYMLGGTMLGAVRHKGFIPWDDDADFGMPRPDFERFLKYAPQYIPRGYALRCHTKGSKEHLYYFPKLINTEQAVNITSRKTACTENVWIDIFPLDGMPDNWVLNRIRQLQLWTLRGLYYLSIFDQMVNIQRINRPWYEKAIIKLCLRFPVQVFFSYEKRWESLDYALKQYPYERSEFIVNLMGGYRFKEMFPKSVFGEGRKYEFEGMLLNGPEDYETYLTQLYGDYMTPPPESERNWHSTEIVENKPGYLEKICTEKKK